MVLDNPAARKGERVRELVGARDCELAFLPAYSPDLNPTEEASSKVKGIVVRKTEARTREAPIEAPGRAPDALTARDARGFFRHCGYRRGAVQLL